MIGDETRLRQILSRMLNSRPTVTSVVLKDSACWSVLRGLNRCAECDRVEHCELPEALQGRKDLLRAELLRNRESIKELKVKSMSITKQLNLLEEASDNIS